MSAHSFDPIAAVLLIPICSAALLAALPGYRDYRSRTAALLPGVF